MSNDDRIVVHFNKKHNEDQTVPPWVVKCQGSTYYVWHLVSEIGFSTKETPMNVHTKGSVMLRGDLRIVTDVDGKSEARIKPSCH
jgi:hypothetical protein